ncbi:hypothetical protein KI387_020337, partial [Taxus chinensis]
EDNIVGSIVPKSLDVIFFAQRPEKALLVRNMYQMLDVNLEDISTIVEDAQRGQDLDEEMEKEDTDVSKKVDDVVKESAFMVSSNFLVPDFRPSLNHISTPRNKSKADVGANKASPGWPSEKEKRDKVTKKYIIEGHQKPLVLGKKSSYHK